MGNKNRRSKPAFESNAPKFNWVSETAQAWTKIEPPPVRDFYQYPWNNGNSLRTDDAGNDIPVKDKTHRDRLDLVDVEWEDLVSMQGRDEGGNWRGLNIAKLPHVAILAFCKNGYGSPTLKRITEDLEVWRIGGVSLDSLREVVTWIDDACWSETIPDYPMYSIQGEIKESHVIINECKAIYRMHLDMDLMGFHNSIHKLPFPQYLELWSLAIQSGSKSLARILSHQFASCLRSKFCVDDHLVNKVSLEDILNLLQAILNDENTVWTQGSIKTLRDSVWEYAKSPCIVSADLALIHSHFPHEDFIERAIDTAARKMRANSQTSVDHLKLDQSLKERLGTHLRDLGHGRVNRQVNLLDYQVQPKRRRV